MLRCFQFNVFECLELSITVIRYCTYGWRCNLMKSYIDICIMAAIHISLQPPKCISVKSIINYPKSFITKQEYKSRELLQSSLLISDLSLSSSCTPPSKSLAPLGVLPYLNFKWLAFLQNSINFILVFAVIQNNVCCFILCKRYSN